MLWMIIKKKWLSKNTCKTETAVGVLMLIGQEMAYISEYWFDMSFIVPFPIGLIKEKKRRR